MKNDKTDFTQGRILPKLAFFMLPILGALVLQAAYGAVDLLVVGRFGSTSGLSAVSTGSQVLNLVTFVVTQLAMGVTVLIARYLGEKRPQYIGQVIGGAVRNSGAIGALAQTGDRLGGEQHTLAQSGFAVAAVAKQADVANVIGSIAHSKNYSFLQTGRKTARSVPRQFSFRRLLNSIIYESS